MAQLFGTFAEFKQFVGGAINTSLELNSIAPIIEDTAIRHIVPYLSKDFYDSLVAAYVGSPTHAQTALLPFVRRALALLTIYEYAKVGGIQLGEAGMHRIETESRKAAFRYQEKQYSEYFLEKGYDAAEVCIKFLTDNIGTYPTWASSAEGLTHRNSLLRYATDFRRILQLQCDRYTFQCLRPIMSEVERFGVQYLLPKGFWTDFIAKHVANTLNSSEKMLLDMMLKSIAHRAVEEATKQHWITIKSGRVYIQEEFGEQSQVNRTMPGAQGSGLYVHHQIWSDRHTSDWVCYMYDNPTLFPLAFDVASGGTSIAADAFHINTTTEQEEANTAAIERNKRPIFRL